MTLCGKAGGNPAAAGSAAFITLHACRQQV